MIDDGLVRVDGETRPAGYRVREGERIEFTVQQEIQAALPPVVAVSDDFAAVDKPAGMHSAALAGRSNVSVESLLPSLFPDRDVVLVNRLDAPTSGLVIAAFGRQGADAYRAYEDSGSIQKTYLAQVCGHLREARTISSALDTADRKAVRVLDVEAEPLRHTRVLPLKYDAEQDRTLVEAVIHKGARHQIRVHLASIGHAIAGDQLYGTAEDEPLHLRHVRIELPGFSAQADYSLEQWTTSGSKEPVSGR